MMGIIAVCGLPLMAFTACNPSMPGMRWSMKIASGRLLFKYSMACSADSAMSTSMSYFSSIRLKMTRADLESSTTKALFRAIRLVRCSRRRFQRAGHCLASTVGQARLSDCKRWLVPTNGRGRPPRGQDVSGRIDVPIVYVSTCTAHPSPYNEHVQTCRAHEGLAGGAFSRLVSLIDDNNAPAGLLALVLQLRLEHAPPGIQHGFGHPSLRQFQAAHIADFDGLIVVYDFS